MGDQDEVGGPAEEEQVADEGPTEEELLAAEAKAKKLAEPRKIKIEIVDEAKANPCTFITQEGAKNQATGKIRKALSDALGVAYNDIKMLKKQKDSEVIMGLKDTDRAPLSLFVKGVAKLPKGVLLDKERALALQQELYTEYASEKFQADFKKHVSATSGKDRAVGIKDMIFAVQKGVLEKYGFEVTPNGAATMSMFFIVCYSTDTEIQDMNNKINELLVTPPEAPGAAATPTAATGTPDSRRLELKVLDNEKGGVCVVVTEVGQETQTVGYIRKNIAAAFETPLASVKLHKSNKAVLTDSDRAPNSIWVSGIAKLPKGILLSKTQALGLQQDLLSQYSKDSFQNARKQLFANADGKERTKGMKDLTFAQQQDVLKKYGFEVTQNGAIHMSMFFMFCYLNDFEIQDMNNKLNTLLGTDPTFVPGQNQGQPAQAQPQGPPKLWLVLNEEKGSILIREAKDLASPEVGRLNTGSCVAEMALEGDRLCYAKVQGDGPQTGWASVNVKGKAMLRQLGPLWAVLNPEKGSLLVRQGQDLTSPEVGRITTGATIEQLTFEGDRLQFQRLSGEGPSTGWVSTTVKGKEMCKRF